MTVSQPSRLTLWRDITPYPYPLIKPHYKSPHILVIGAGVTGLIVSWVLLDKGYNVTVLSKDWTSFEQGKRLTSQIAGALWEYPPAVCGLHTDAVSLQHAKEWSMIAYHIWDGIASVPELGEAAGVRMKQSAFFFPKPVEEDPDQHEKMLEIIASGVRGFVRSPEILEKRGVGHGYDAVDAYEFMAPVIDTDKAMQWLMTLVRGKGARYITGTIDDDLVNVEGALAAQFNADAIVNASGLQSYHLAGDKTCYPLRGGLIRVINDGSDFPKVNTAMAISADAAHSENEFVFLLPRNDNTLVMGGFAEPHEWELNLTLDSPVVKKMRERCEAFLPVLKIARLDPEYPFAQGLRPSREQNVRVERESRRAGSRIVHSYGHGGSGWSFSFGCAQDVAMLVDEISKDLPPKSRSGRPYFGRADFIAVRKKNSITDNGDQKTLPASWDTFNPDFWLIEPSPEGRKR
ncbi:nucleotide-binding domain-containing protein [Zopfia rhizophila CBS 207.26]|uniref:Nucleotide-binding domain-containing protein n=1 Tax=Zopfia rhizophila CBS 207.26 TaxID=1314779 RepID=A0A6A6DQ93_9PEZI|nr:nucleotide-binding domain-containing protein [Zopfia rhizophila CBS 207.26]